MAPAPPRSRSTLLALALLWLAFYASFTLGTPPLLDDADSVHAEVAREMLLRHDYVTLYANGIRYLEKAPLMYWSMALSMRVSQAFGGVSARALAVAARLPIALCVLGLALVAEALARRMFRSARAGLYAALILLSSFGVFLFTRITLPDAGVCLWTALALYCFWCGDQEEQTRFRWRAGFAAACALNVLTKGLIGVVFPVAIALLWLVLTRGWKGAWARFRLSHELAEIGLFLLIAAPWHVLAGLANPTEGHPQPFVYTHGHWQVPLPTDGNVRGWFWFYFMNEHLLRYLNLRIPRDYDTSPLWLFWGLCLVWIMPWSAFVFKAAAVPFRQWTAAVRARVSASRRAVAVQAVQPDRSQTLLAVWAALPLLFFSLSTRQEYYVLPALPAFAILIAGWLAEEGLPAAAAEARRRALQRCTMVLLCVGAVFAAGAGYFLLHGWLLHQAPAPSTDLATLLAQDPSDYALSMGHFLDLNAQALGLFRLPLAIAAVSLFGGPLASYGLRRQRKPHAAVLALAAGAFGFLLAAHLGLRTFSPVLSSAHLAQAIRAQVKPEDLVMIHGEYESGSTLGFYLQRSDVHILEGRSSNLWYGSFFPDAPRIFETPETVAQRWNGAQRIFLWQAVTLPDAPRPLRLPGPVYVLASGGGKEILSNQPNR